MPADPQDDFATGHQGNLDEATVAAGSGQFTMIGGDIRDRAACETAVAGADIVLHQAALGSVPRSLADPLTSHDVNVTGFLNMLDAARHQFRSLDLIVFDIDDRKPQPDPRIQIAKYLQLIVAPPRKLEHQVVRFQPVQKRQ